MVIGSPASIGALDDTRQGSERLGELGLEAAFQARERTDISWRTVRGAPGSGGDFGQFDLVVIFLASHFLLDKPQLI